ncbi:RHS repeat protein [Tunicatimonas pelagia]|uniref:RHS repeat protein n=1 Tax=Tunicatimonas pelagia TaxID=931531 RepID=UPI002666AF0A|nr:RHS repeat-associated core domain-containing protein [Tunicatimonas pelagia]WKN44222.1 RHS repeat-associated core domain-containing protein [Tunicatimonas pelagia]
MKFSIQLFFIAIVWFSTIAATRAQNLPVERRYVCVGQTSSSFIDYEHFVPPSSDNITAKCKTKVKAILNNDDAFPDFPDGAPFIQDGYHVFRNTEGIDYFQIDLDWTPGWTGTVTVTIQYRKQEPNTFDPTQDCRNDGDWTDLVNYVITRGSLIPDGELEGPAVIGSATGSATLDLSYAPSEEYGSSLSSMLFYASYQGGSPVQLGTAVASNNTFSLTTSIDGFGEYAITTQLVDDCGELLTGPAKTVFVRPSCYEDPTPVLRVSGPGVVEFPEGFRVEPGQEYTIVAQGSTDFDEHFSLEDDGGDRLNLYRDGGAWKFTTSDDWGSYRIVPTTDTVRATFCSVPDPLRVFVGGNDTTIAQPCPMVLPEDLNVAFGQAADSDPDNLVLKHFSATIRSQTQIVVKPGIILSEGAELVLDYVPADSVTGPDGSRYFVNTTRYNDFGEVVAEGRVYLDGSGRSHQRQAKNLAQGVTLATATLYDEYGRPTVQTLAAPVSGLPQAGEDSDCTRAPFPDQALTFGYAEGFVSDAAGNPITQAPALSGSGVDPMSLGTSEGTLGWYYSTQNGTTTKDSIRRMQEVGVPITTTPYTRMQYRADGEVQRVSQPGDPFRLGGARVAQQDKAPVAGGDATLASYLALRAAFSLPPVGNVSGNYFTRTATGVDGKRSQTYYDRAGRALVRHYFGTQGTPITTSYTIYDLVGRVIAVVSPKGVAQYATGTPLADLELTRYFYNSKGQVTAVEEPETGRTEYLYRQDGQIRFSQNAGQRETGAFSYTHYDHLARPVESGEYRGGPAFGSATLQGTLESIASDGGLSGGTRHDWQRTYYDTPPNNIPGGRSPAFVRGRIAYQTFTSGDSMAPTVTTYYSYDERGRLTWAVKDIAGLGTKTIDYTYHPSGGLRDVAYQRNAPEEAFFHYYTYNGNARLQQVYTSRKAPDYNARGEITNLSDFSVQGTYDYYRHGPRKRTELGQHRQGLDYTYTAQGWLKGINSSVPTADPGNDGQGNGVRPDLFGTTLHYFAGDYQGSGLTTPEVLLPNAPEQFSGTLQASSWHNANEPGTTHSYAYQYDQRDQLTQADFGTADGSSGAAHRVTIGGYDAHGNLGQLTRKGDVGQALADYTYQYQGNQLTQVSQGGQAALTYQHNALGQLEQQTEEGQTVYYTYDAFRRMSGVYANEGRTQAVATFTYDERGQRLSKTAFDEAGQATFRTWYVYGPDGRLLSLYADNLADELPAAPYEVPLYGAGRLGQYRPLENTYYHEVQDHLGSVRAVIGGDTTYTFLATAETPRQTLEETYFTPIQRKPVPPHLNHTPETVVSGADQAMRINNDQIDPDEPRQPLGTALMRQVYPGDTLRAEVFAKYEHFQGNDRDGLAIALTSYLAGAFGLPATGEGAFLAEGEGDLIGVIRAAVLDLPPEVPQAGLGYLLFDHNLDVLTQGWVNVSQQAQVQGEDALSQPFERLALEPILVEQTGFIYFFVANYDKRNITVFLDDLKVTHQTTDVVYAADYYPHGEVMDGRKLEQATYRYGYQGAFAEQDDETGLASFQLRQYDSRIGRWTTPDPYNQYWSPYLGMGNAPNMMIDPDGGFAKGPSLWTRLKAWISGGNISNSGRFVFDAGRSISWKKIGLQALKTAGTLASSNAWRLNAPAFELEPLTKKRLRELGGNIGIPTGDMPFELELGYTFEGHARHTLNLGPEGGNIDTPERLARGGRPQTRPDALRGVAEFGSGTKYYHSSSIFEMKAYKKTNNITLSTSEYQVLGLLEIAENSPAGQDDKAVLTFITPFGVSIGQDVIDEASGRGVALYQIVAFELILQGERTGQIGYFAPQPVSNPDPLSRVQLHGIGAWSGQYPLDHFGIGR